MSECWHYIRWHHKRYALYLIKSGGTWRDDGGGGVVGRHREVDDLLALRVDVDAGGAHVRLHPVDRVSNCLPVNLFTGKTILLELLVTVLIGYYDYHLMTLSFTCFISF